MARSDWSNGVAQGSLPTQLATRLHAAGSPRRPPAARASVYDNIYGRGPCGGGGGAGGCPSSPPDGVLVVAGRVVVVGDGAAGVVRGVVSAAGAVASLHEEGDAEVGVRRRRRLLLPHVRRPAVHRHVHRLAERLQLDVPAHLRSGERDVSPTSSESQLKHNILNFFIILPLFHIVSCLIFFYQTFLNLTKLDQVF